MPEHRDELGQSSQQNRDAEQVPQQPSEFRQNLTGIVFMCICCFCFALNDSFMKFTSDVIPLGEAVAIRGLFGSITLFLLAVSTGQLKWHRDLFSRSVLWRTFFESMTTFFILSAIYNMPLANANAIIQAVPFLLIIYAAYFTDEPIGYHRWAAVFLGLLGVLLVIQPGTAGFNAWSIAALFAALCVVTRDIKTRQIPSHVNSLMIGLIGTIANAMFGIIYNFPAVWVMPSPQEWVYLMGAGTGIGLAFYTGAAAMRFGSFIAVNPFRYTLLLWSVLFGFIFWGELPNLLAWLGIVIIIAMGLFTLYRENRRRAA